MRKLLLVFIIAATSIENFAQPAAPVFKDAIARNRERIYNHLVQNTITKNLSVPLTDSTEDMWEDAFYALELIRQKNIWVNQKVKFAVDDMLHRSIHFQRSLLELLFSNYQEVYSPQVKTLFENTIDPKIFAIAGEYLLNAINTSAEKNALLILAKKRSGIFPESPHSSQLIHNIIHYGKKSITPSFQSFLKKDYLKGNTLMISFQRMNRNYPGLVMVRDSSGNFIKNSNSYFAVPQLARSISNLPGYITNGNTPEGIFRMDGFDISRISMIGPTNNVQLTMPFEFNAFHFYRDSTLSDTIGNITLYKNLLPKNFRNHYPMHQSFYAGKAGRSEIIAHGTTIDPSFYTGMPYYPLTPTIGCLCTKEIWSMENGKRLESNQQLLVDAITEAGGPYGYAIVINIDDKQSAVTLEDILPFLKLAGQK